MPDQLEDNKENVSKEESNGRKRMVVEELGVPEAMPVSELKEKVEELQDITDEIGKEVEKSVEVEEELAKAVDKQEEFIAPVQTPSFSPLIVIIPGILLLGALLGGIVFYQKMMNTDSENVITTPAPITETSPSPVATTSATTSLTKYAIVVQNGSGIPGEAGKAQVALEKEGFKVGSTGNADNYNYTKSIIKAKATVEKDYLEALVKALGKTYSVDKNQILAASSKDDVQIIIGSVKSGN